MIEIGIDIGGTFTDVVCLVDNEQIFTTKTPSTKDVVGGVRAGMGYCGCKTLDELRTKARFIQVTAASVQESHPHDIAITQEAPNYSPADYAADAGG